MPYMVTITTEVKLTDASSIYDDLVTREVNIEHYHEMSLIDWKNMGLNDVHAALIFLMLANLRRTRNSSVQEDSFDRIEEFLGNMSDLFDDTVETEE